MRSVTPMRITPSWACAGAATRPVASMAAGNNARIDRFPYCVIGVSSTLVSDWTCVTVVLLLPIANLGLLGDRPVGDHLQVGSHAMAAHPDLVAEITTDIEKPPCRWSSDPAAEPS